MRACRGSQPAGRRSDTAIQDGRRDLRRHLHAVPRLRPSAAAGRFVERCAASRLEHVGSSAERPTNLIRIVLQGIAPADGERGPFMPGYSGALTDDQVAALIAYVRAEFTDRPAWQNVDREIRRVRKSFAEIDRLRQWTPS